MFASKREAEQAADRHDRRGESSGSDEPPDNGTLVPVLDPQSAADDEDLKDWQLEAEAR